MQRRTSAIHLVLSTVASTLGFPSVAAVASRGAGAGLQLLLAPMTACMAGRPLLVPTRGCCRRSLGMRLWGRQQRSGVRRRW